MIPDADLRPVTSNFGHCAANPGNDANFQKSLDKNITDGGRIVSALVEELECLRAMGRFERARRCAEAALTAYPDVSRFQTILTQMAPAAQDAPTPDILFEDEYRLTLGDLDVHLINPYQVRDQGLTFNETPLQLLAPEACTFSMI